MEGLPEPLPDMVEHFVMDEAGDRLWAVASGGAVHVSALEQQQWHLFKPELRKVQALDLAAG